MTIETEAKITLTVEDHASAIVRSLRRDFDALNKSVVATFGRIKSPGPSAAVKPSTVSRATDALTIKSEAAAMAGLRKRFAFATRMSWQRATEAKIDERQHRAFQSDAVRRLRERMTLTGRMTRQRAIEAKADERQRRSYDSAAMADIRRRMAFAGRMARQQLVEARAVEREQKRVVDVAERNAASTLRRQIAGDRWRFQLRERMDRRDRQDRLRDRRAQARDEAGGRREIGHGFDQVGSAISRSFSASQGVTVFGTVAAAAAAKAVDSAFVSRMKTESAETDLRMFGSTVARPSQAPKKMSAADVAEIRAGWLDNASMDSGVSAATGIRTYTEVLKAGIPEKDAEAMTKLVLTGSAGMDMNTAEVTRIMGRMSTVMGGKDGVGADRMQKVLTGMAIAASETAANPDEIVSGMSRGMGALSLGMSPEDLAAWVATGASTGIQAAKTGNFVSTLLQKGAGAKNQRGQGLKDMNTAAKMVGLGNAKGMSKAAASDPNAFLEHMFEKVDGMSVEKRSKFSQLMGGMEWDDEILQMKQGLETLKKTRAAIKDERNKNFLSDNKDLKGQSLTGLWARMKVQFGQFWEGFGHGFTDTFTEVATWFISSGRAVNLAGVRSIGASFMTGLVNGLGFTSWTKLLNEKFSDAGKIDWGRINTNVQLFAQGAGETIKSMTGFAKGFMETLGFEKFDPKALGQVAAGFVGLSFGLVLLRPVIGLFRVIGSGLGIVAGGVTALGGALSALGLGGFTGAGARILGGMGFSAFAGGAAGLGLRAAGAAALAGLTIVGGGVLLAGLAGIGALYVAITNWGAIKGWIGGGSMNDVDRKAAEDSINRQQGDDSLASRIWNWLNRSGDATVQRQSYGGEHNGAFDRRGMIQNTSFGGSDRSYGSFRGFEGAQLIRAALTAPGTGTSLLSGMGFNSGAMSGGGAGAGSGGPRVPGWFNRGGSSSGSGMVGFGANPGAYKGFLDYVAKQEGTVGGKNGGYDVTLANGKLLPGEREQDLTKMTLDQIDRMQSGMLQHPGNSWNSSAAGRYQIVQKTLRSLRQKFGLKGDDLFDEKMQDRLGGELARARGANPNALGQEWASLRGGKAQEAAALLGQVPSGSSTTPDNRPAEVVAGVHGSTANATGGAAGAVDVARKYMGMDEDGDHAILKKFMGREIKGAQNAWCAAFVNSSLEAVGLKSTKSGVANSYLGWGKGVDANDVHKGDVAVEHRSKGLNATGGHVGLATGNKRVNDKGELEIEVIQGNSDNQVKAEWENARKLAIRRSTDPKAALSATPKAREAVDGFRSSGLKNPEAFSAVPACADQAADMVRQGQGFGAAKVPTAEDLAARVPVPASRGRGAGGDVLGLDAGGSRFKAGGAGRSVTVHAPVTIHAGNQSPQEMAGHMQRHITEAWNFRSHDLEPELT